MFVGGRVFTAAFTELVAIIHSAANASIAVRTKTIRDDDVHTGAGALAASASTVGVFGARVFTALDIPAGVGFGASFDTVS